MSKDTQINNHFPCECACHDPSYRYKTIPCESCASSTPSTKDTTQIHKQIEEAVKSFRKEFNCPIVNGEPMGAGELLNEPIESFLRDTLKTIATKSAEVEQKRIKEIIDMEYHRIMFVAYPYAGVQIKDLSNLKRAMFDYTKRGDKARTLLSEAVKLDLRERKIEAQKEKQQ